MLTIYFKDIDAPTESVLQDVEEAFESVHLTGTQIERAAIKELAEGKYLDDAFFLDEFGTKLPVDCLSIGCKAMITVGFYPDKVVNCIECSDDVLSTLVEHCRDGAIIIYAENHFMDIGNVDGLCVKCRSHVFTDSSEFRNYMRFYAPEEFDDYD